MNVWVLALLVTCVMPDGNTHSCRVIENSIYLGHSVFLKKEDCLADIEGSLRRTCVEMRKEQ